MSEATLHLIVAAFNQEDRAEEALKTLKESRDEKLVGIQAAVTLHKDGEGQIHFKDAGLTPAKGAVGGVVLGAVVGVLTGGTGLALGALGALVGGLVGRKKRDSRFQTDRINQLAASLPPGSSAILVVMEPGWAVVLEEELALLGADVLSADIPADLAEHSEADQEAAYATLIDTIKHTGD
ncbi:MAG TPA: DUF1269 domain-containing protein [Anaerolineae bacterium]|nr:DUF1269 domain-containing protein [Anaerolineae bacterium]